MDENLMERLRERARKNRFTTHNHIELVAVDEQSAQVRLAIRDESKNPFGTVHGGALYTMADNAAGFAAHADGRQYVTQTGSMSFISNRAEGVITATARVRHRGRATCLTCVDVAAEDGTLLATGEFTFFCTGGK
ncbi:MAG: PaaI family thioesterase [Oscillibacter sp.]|nr:PaaI family thioesterase [Oscillibacter sp.]